ncbi:MAG: hypothetical protein L0Z73_12855 [Gammaproteobacteria bacterium]|nr:hypothetical protein [Gammaproteobacteria bacterium]
MGLLDDLRKQSESKQIEEQHANNRKEKAEQYYREKVQPKLNEIYTHFNELAKHLNYVKPNTVATYTINATGLQAEFKQQDYKVQVDSMTDTNYISIRCTCARPTDVEFVVDDPAAVNKHKHYFNINNMNFQTYPRNNGEPGARFTVKAEIPVEFLFKGDRENGRINLVVSNFDNLGRRNRELTVQDINDNFLDALDRYLIRENADFFKLTINEKAKEEIRAKVQEEQRRRMEELKEMERLAQEEQLREKLEKENKGVKKGLKLMKNIPAKKIFKQA